MKFGICPLWTSLINFLFDKKVLKPFIFIFIFFNFFFGKMSTAAQSVAWLTAVPVVRGSILTPGGHS